MDEVLDISTWLQAPLSSQAYYNRVVQGGYTDQPLKNDCEELVRETTRFENVPGEGDQFRTFDRSPASTRVTRKFSRTNREEPREPELSRGASMVVSTLPSALANASPAGPPPTMTTSHSSCAVGAFESHLIR